MRLDDRVRTGPLGRIDQDGKGKAGRNDGVFDMNANEVRDLNRTLEALCKLGLLFFGVASGLFGLILWFAGLVVWGGLGLLGFIIEVATFVSIFRWYVRNTQGGLQLFARITSKGRGLSRTR